MAADNEGQARARAKESNTWFGQGNRGAVVKPGVASPRSNPTAGRGGINKPKRGRTKGQ